MANTRFAQDGLVSAKLDRRSTTPEFALGTVAIGNNGQVFVYGLAGAAIGTGARTLNATTFVITATAGLHTADVAFADGEYGFIRKTVSPFLADPA
jgi:hypothetical protein